MQVGLTHLFGGIIALILIVGGAFMVGTKWAAPETSAASAAASQEVEAETSSTIEAAREEAEERLFDVVKVIDGDTITIKIDGKNETVRLIGIDTPETSDPRTGVQCFGKEATAKLKSVIGKRVSIEKDVGEGERDKYGRLLAYIYNEEGTLLNKYLVAQGYAYEYTYDDPYKYQKEFKAAEVDAKTHKRGLWAPDACPEPNAPAPAATKTAVPVQPAAAATAQTAPKEQEEPITESIQTKEESKPKPEPETEPVSTSSYTCSSNKYNCSDFKTHAEAQRVFEQCGGVDNDIHKLDNNKDGEACESLP